MKKIPLIFILLFATNCLAQLSKTHYIPPLTSNPDAAYPEDHYIYISTPSVKDVKFKIIPIGGLAVSNSVSKSAPYRYDIGNGESSQLFVPRSITGKSSNKGFIIESEGLVYVNIRTNSVRNNTGSYNHAGGLVAKGNSGSIRALYFSTNSALINFSIATFNTIEIA